MASFQINDLHLVIQIAYIYTDDGYLIVTHYTSQINESH